ATTDELFQIENAHEYVVYVADRDHPSWSRLCLGQADAILTVAEGKAAPQSAPNLGESVGRGIPVMLILNWSAGQQPGRTADWLRRTGASRHFHVRGPSDLQRMVRLLTGKGFGLVLSGGGARGFAHIGVLRALREHGIE